MTSQPAKRTITTHILPNNSGSKSKQGKTFGQVTYNKRNKFLQKMRQADQVYTSFQFLKTFTWGKSKWAAAQFEYNSTALSLE